MRSRPAFLAVVPLLGAAAFAGSGDASAATTLWPMYHLDAGRSGNDTNEPSFNHMSKAWFSSTLDGAVYAEPLVDGGTGNGCGEVELPAGEAPSGPEPVTS